MRHLATLLLLTCLWDGAVACAEEPLPQWERMDPGLGETRFVAIAVDEARVFAATPHTLYESTDHGVRWESRFQTPGSTTIRRIAVGGTKQSAILVATDQGLYGSFDRSHQWVRVFQGIGDEEAYGTYVAFHPGHPEIVLLGTRHGLFISRDEGRHWQPVNATFSAQDIVQCAFDPTDPARVFLVTASELYTGNLATGEWQRRFSHVVTHSAVEEVPTVTTDADTRDEAEASRQQLGAVALDPRHASTLYLTGPMGFQMSRDGGKTWRPLTRSGLLSTAISRLVPYAHSPLVIYAATAQGIARYEPDHDRWRTLTHGLASGAVNDLAVTAHDLWAATDNGLYRAHVIVDAFAADTFPAARDLLSNFVHEPTMNQVREVAIRYAEVHPGKIAAWRTQARLRAVLPKISVTSGTNATDFRHWDTGSNPDSLLRGERDLDWDANISWDLADLIWSDEQTSIDSRSKLMVELRDDLVNEVTRTYFERRRLQVALLTDPLADPRETLERELRIQELTALIDGLTGGYFSHNITPQHKERSADGTRD